MPHSTAPYTIDPAEFPGSFDNYTPAREFLAKFAEIQRGAFDNFKTVVDDAHAELVASVEAQHQTIRDDLVPRFNAMGTQLSQSVLEMSGAAAINNIPLADLDAYSTQVMPRIADEGPIMSPAAGEMYHPTQPYKFSYGPNFATIHYHLNQSLPTTDPNVPANRREDNAHGVMYSIPSLNVGEGFVFAMQRSEVIHVEDNHPFFGRVAVLRQDDGHWARYYGLTNWARWKPDGTYTDEGPLKVGQVVPKGWNIGVAGEFTWVDLCTTNALEHDPWVWYGDDYNTIAHNFEDIRVHFADVNPTEDS